MQRSATTLIERLGRIGRSLDRQRLALHAIAGNLEASEAGGTSLLSIRLDAQGRVTAASTQAGSLIRWNGTPTPLSSLLTTLPDAQPSLRKALANLDCSAVVEATIAHTGVEVLIVIAEVNNGGATLLLWPLDQHSESAPAEDIRQLARRASHDFNNALSTMVGYAELAMMLSNEPRIAHYLSEIYTSGKRGQGLVNAFQQHLTNSSPRALTSDDAARGHVLVVDDESSVADLLTEILRSAGFAVSTTYSPDEALKLFRRDPAGFDLLITDQTMPEMTGLALAQEITRIRADLPFVLCTGWGDTVQVQQDAKTHVRNYVAKPIEADALVSLVEQLIIRPASSTSTAATP